MLSEAEWLTTDAILAMVPKAFPNNGPQVSHLAEVFINACWEHVGFSANSPPSPSTALTVGTSVLGELVSRIGRLFLSRFGGPGMPARMRIISAILQTQAQANPGVDPSNPTNIRQVQHCRWQADLLREIVGNPYRKQTIAPSWRTRNVLDLARTIQEEKCFDRMLILGDALMDAGCEEAAIIEHCQQTFPHVPGCWLLRQLLNTDHEE